MPAGCAVRFVTPESFLSFPEDETASAPFAYPFGEGRIASNWRDLEVALVQAPVLATVLATVRWLR